MGGSRSVAQETIIQHSLAILRAVVGPVEGRVIHVLVEGRDGALGPGESANSLPRWLLEVIHLQRH